MRMPRIKAKNGESGLYHCMSRTVSGEYILGMTEKEAFVQMMWRVADFLSIEILDYIVMSNHYHQLVRVRGVINLNDDELLDRLKCYYGSESLEALTYKKEQEKGGEAFSLLKAKHLNRMCNISEFQKILKQGFSVWFNKRHKRHGTLWMERFKSVLVQDSLNARRIIATYIDLNSVRAEIVEDPKDYRHCGYAAAIGNDQRCRSGIMQIMGIDNWKEASVAYRLLLIKRGHKQVSGKKGSVTRELLLETLAREGQLHRSELLRLRVRYFSDGLVLGSELFVEEVFERYRSHFGEKRKSGARPIRGFPDDGLKVIRDLRLNPVS